ncbi:MAG: hypothetical protein WA991_09225 [Ornithinimicrobium sp.]
MRILGLIFVSVLVVAGCSDTSSEGNGDPAAQSVAEEAGEEQGETAALQRSMDPATVLDTGADTAGEAAAAVSAALFVSSPSVVVAAADDSESIASGAEVATDAGIPLVLIDSAETPDGGAEGDAAASTSEGPSDVAAAALAEIDRLEATTAMAVGTEVEQTLSSQADIEVVSDASDLPDLDDIDGLSDLVVLVHDDDTSQGSASAAAATATATAAGATVLALPEPDVRADPEAIEVLSDMQPASVLAAGSDFGTVEQLTARVDVAKTGVQLPGGGQTVFPGRRLVALYGNTSTPALGVLGEQDVDASIDRARDMAEEFDPLSDVQAVPTFEIIVTVAQASAGADGDYSYETPVDEIRPWVEKAGEEGVYVVLDLQPGRANFLDQAKIYEDLLVMPHVGLALDPEWRLTPTQRPLQQIGSVEAEEVNSVIDWLAELTAREQLPQKVLVLHQFRISMLQDIDQIDMTRDEVAVLIHMDGQGGTEAKDSTWQAVVDNAPEGVPLGWKNFYDEDIPMLSPEQTMTREPTPFMISYQ